MEGNMWNGGVCSRYPDESSSAQFSAAGRVVTRQRCRHMAAGQACLVAIPRATPNAPESMQLQ